MTKFGSTHTNQQAKPVPVFEVHRVDTICEESVEHQTFDSKISQDQFMATFRIAPSMILDSPSLDRIMVETDCFSQHDVQLQECASSLLIPDSPQMKAFFNGSARGSPFLRPFEQEVSDAESYGIQPMPIFNESLSESVDLTESPEKLFSPNKLANCFIIQAREERRFKLNEMEIQIREELEQLQNMKPNKLTI